MESLLDAIRKAIERSGQTRYRIAKGTGVSQAHLSRLMSGERGLSVESLELLADHLGLRITVRPKHQRRRGVREGRR
jgi:transcriptional regulator with XRE-family HTH domain